MRKLLSITLLFAFATLVSCGADTDTFPRPDEEEHTLRFEVESLEHNRAVITITPPSDIITYYASLHPDTEEFMKRDGEEIFLDIRFSDGFEDNLCTESVTRTFDGLVGHSYYRIVYFQYDTTINKKVGDVILSERITTPDAPELFDIEISDIKGLSANIHITPPDNKTSYFFWLYTMDSYERYQHSSDYELLQYDYSFWAYVSQLYGYTLEEVIANDIVTGEVTINTDYMLYIAEWDTEYLVWAYGITPSGEVTTPITRKQFRTLAPEPSSMTFEVPNIELMWKEHTTEEGTIRGWEAEATIIPSSKEERYFATITNKDWYDWYFTEDNDGRSDEAFIQNAILRNTSKSSAELPTMYKSGDFNFNCFVERGNLLRPEREYALFLFGVDDNGATTSLNIYPFTTEAAPQQ